MCAACDSILVSVSNESAERFVFLDAEDGIMRRAARGALVLNLGTSSVAWARELHCAAEDSGLAFLDAPVSGGPEGAATGALSVMCGGDAATFEHAEPVLEAIAGYTALRADPARVRSECSRARDFRRSLEE